MSSTIAGPARIAVSEIVDGAALVHYPGAADSDASAAALSLYRLLGFRSLPGLLDAIPGARTLLLLYDPGRTTLEDLARAVLHAQGPAPRSPTQRRAIRIPVCYGGANGPDLSELAGRAGVSAEAFVRLHAAGRYAVAFIGFAPGFPYMTGLAEDLHAPRLATPRTRVPAGSVGIGGSYTGIYPGATPGGWRLIGRAPIRLYDPDADPPALLQPEDEVTFEPIDDGELRRREAAFLPAAARSFRGRSLFRVLSPGLWTSVQGAPRFGFGSSGLAPGGAMDPTGLAAGNARLGNAPEAAGLEITLLGPELESLESCRIVVSGAEASLERNGTRLAAEQVHDVRKGDRIRLGRTQGAARSYLCVEGGLEVPDRPAPSRRLEAADRIHAAPEAAAAVSGPAVSPVSGTGPLRVVLAADGDQFPPEAVQKLVSQPYRVSGASDRRGIRLEGEPLPGGSRSEIPPEGTALGSIQVPPDGLPILLGPDRPITGGYPRIGTLVAEDWPRAAQALPAAELRFEVLRAARTFPGSDSRRGGR